MASELCPFFTADFCAVLCQNIVIVLQKAKNRQAESTTKRFLGFLNCECCLFVKKFLMPASLHGWDKNLFPASQSLLNASQKHVFAREKTYFIHRWTRSTSITLLILLYFIIAHRVVSSFMNTN